VATRFIAALPAIAPFDVAEMIVGKGVSALPRCYVRAGLGADPHSGSDDADTGE